MCLRFCVLSLPNLHLQIKISATPLLFENNKQEVKELVKHGPNTFNGPKWSDKDAPQGSVIHGKR